MSTKWLPGEGKGPLANSLALLMQSAFATTPTNREGAGWKKSALETPRSVLLFAGVHMEETITQVKAANAEMREVLAEMNAVKTQVFDISGVVGPLLIEEVKSLRGSRMAVVAEVRDSLKALAELRGFFMGDTHDAEMKRLERFVAVCREIKELKESGVLDAVSSLRIK